jgi:hypothetical protein
MGETAVAKVVPAKLLCNSYMVLELLLQTDKNLS